MSGRWLIETLEEAGAEGATIDDVLIQAQALQGSPIKNATPFAVASAVKSVRVLESQQGLGFPITGLLPQVGARIIPAMVPDKSPGSKSNPVTRLLHSPAD